MSFEDETNGVLNRHNCILEEQAREADHSQVQLVMPPQQQKGTEAEPPIQPIGSAPKNGTSEKTRLPNQRLFSPTF